MEHEHFLMIILIFGTLLMLKLWSKLHNNRHHKKLPPCPKRLPFLGNLHQLIGDLPHICLQKLSKEHGPLMFLQLGSIPTLVISSSHVAKDIFKNHDLIFSSRPQLYAGKWLSYQCYDITFAPYGEYWREVRKIVLSEVLSMKRVQSFRSTREEEAEHMVNLIVQGSSGPVNLSELTLSLANNVICRVAYGKKYDPIKGFNGKSNAYEILNMTQTLLGEFNVADFYPWLGSILNKVNGVDSRLKKNFRELNDILDEVLEEHRHSTRRTLDNEDIVDVLLRLQKDPNQAIALTNNQVKGILVDMFVAGSDTSAVTLVWIMAELIKNPPIMKKVQDEVRRVVNGKQRVEESDLPKLSYMKLIIKEALRLHPPAPLLVPRETTEPCKIGEYEIPAKTRVFINAKAIAMDPNVWDNPEKFEPERFLHSSIDYKGHNFELIPFGIGRRSCPAMNFAVLTVEIALANLLYRFDWSLPKGMTTDDIDMVEATGLTMHKKEPLLLMAIPKFLY
ncbi:cytochrome P450 71A9-like [Silene latifolia]|uniref:cytochrome P450 71A9-like n=1 Tax=Silene latifolia TaxID=37657 RepID=UPI003D781AA7